MPINIKATRRLKKYLQENELVLRVVYSLSDHKKEASLVSFTSLYVAAIMDESIVYLKIWLNHNIFIPIRHLHV